MVISNRIVRLLAAGALALSAPALAACSTEMPTDKVYNQAVGTNERHASTIDVLNAMIVSTEAGSGTFITTLVNNENKTTGEDAQAQLIGLTVKVDNPETEDPDDFALVEVEVPRGLVVPAGEHLVLAGGDRGEGGIKVIGDFPEGSLVPGHYAEMTLTFEGADPVTLEVPVVTNTGYHEGEDGEPTPVESPTEAETHEDEAH